MRTSDRQQPSGSHDVIHSVSCWCGLVPYKAVGHDDFFISVHTTVATSKVVHIILFMKERSEKEA